MSAFVCSDRHIATIAQWYGDRFRLGESERQEIADLLKKENVRSVNYRYRERQRAGRCDLTQAAPDTQKPEIVAALCNSLRYQSCERPDYIGLLLNQIQTAAMNASGGRVADDVWSI